MRCLMVGLTIERGRSSAIPLVFVNRNVLYPVQVADLVVERSRCERLNNIGLSRSVRPVDPGDGKHLLGEQIKRTGSCIRKMLMLKLFGLV